MTPAPTYEPTVSTPSPTLVSSVDTDEFLYSMVLSIPLCIILMCIYCLCRVWKPQIWETRRKYANMSSDQNTVDNDDDDDDDDDIINYGSDNDALQRSKSSSMMLPNTTKPITFPQLSNTYFYWMWEVWTMENTTFYYHAGFDALVFRLYLKGCIYICMASLPYALLILLPVYGTSNHGGSLNDVINVLSITTVDDSSARLWAAVVGSYIFTLVSLYYLSKVYLAVAYATDQWLIGNNALEDIDKLSWFNYREMIDNVVDVNLKIAKAPLEFGTDFYTKFKGYSSYVQKKQVGSPDQPSSFPRDDRLEDPDSDAKNINENDVVKTDEEVELLSEEKRDSDIPNQSPVAADIDSIESQLPPIDRYTVMIRNLPKAFQNSDDLRTFFERLFKGKIAKVTVICDVRELTRIEYEIKFHEKALKKLKKKPGYPEIYEGTVCCGCCGDQVNVVTFHETNRDALISKFNKLLKKGLGPTPTAFITFTTLEAASTCISCPIRFGLKNLSITKAPYPADIEWPNLKYTSSDLMPYNLIVYVLFGFLLVFWAIPVVAIQAIANLDTIFGWFGIHLTQYMSTTALSVIQGYTSVLILDLWLQLLPEVCEWLTNIQKKTNRGRTEMLIMTKYFDCLVVMVLLITVLSSAILSNASSMYEYFRNIISSFSKIMTYLAEGLSSMSTYFLLYVLLNTFVWLPLEMFRPSHWIKYYLKRKQPNRFKYEVWFPKTMLILVIVLTYAVMSPIMWILGAFYFIFAYFVFTYNLSMSWIPEFETGAKVWPLVFGRLRFGFFISLITLIGLLFLKQAYLKAGLLIPLLIFAWIATGRLDLQFRAVFRAPSLSSAHDKDVIIENVYYEQNKQIFDNKKEERQERVNHLGGWNKVDYAYLPPILRKRYTNSVQPVVSSNYGINNDSHNVQLIDQNQSYQGL